MAQTGVVSLTLFPYQSYVPEANVNYSGKDNTQSREVLEGSLVIGSSAGPIAVTAYAIVSNVLTLTAVNTLTGGGGQAITLSGFGTSTFLNGVTATTTSATGTTIVLPFTHANASATEAGVATLTPQYLTNGLPITWSFTNSQGGTAITSSYNGLPAPASVVIQSQAAMPYTYAYDPIHKTLRIAAGGTEVTTAANITPDTICFHAEFPR
jgi:hypothetical protein